jgi:flagellar hook-associated protein 3 FlgL
MNSLSLGDLANSFMLQNRSSALQAEMTQLTQELTTGQVSDIKSVLGGNYSYLTDIESSLTALEGYKIANTEAAVFAEGMQLVLGNIHDSTSNLGTNMIVVSSGGLDQVVLQTGREAFEVLSNTMSTLNTQVAGRSLFSGAATDQPALSNADDLMNELNSVVTGSIGSAAKLSAIQNWFDDPLGFDAVIYSGSENGISSFDLAPSETLSLDIKATDPQLKATIRNLAVATIAGNESLVIDPEERSALLQAAGEGLLASQDGLTSLRSEVGYAESRIENHATKNATESVSLEYAKGTLLASDPYEAATRLEEVQFQLQSLYTLTARASQLSLVNFL